MLVAEAMTSHPVTLPPSATVAKAAKAMRDNDIGDVLVVARGGQLCGIVTDRDLVTRAYAEGKKPGTAKLKDICSAELTTVSPMVGAEEAETLMREKAIRRLPVVDDDGKPVGVVSLGDLALQLDRTSALADISRAPANN